MTGHPFVMSRDVGIHSSPAEVERREREGVFLEEVAEVTGG